MSPRAWAVQPSALRKTGEIVGGQGNAHVDFGGPAFAGPSKRVGGCGCPRDDGIVQRGDALAFDEGPANGISFKFDAEIANRLRCAR